MAKFEIAYQRTNRFEGGWNHVKGDSGGETYCGIARNFHPKWPGWKLIDARKPIRYNTVFKDEEIKRLVRDFYKRTFWDAIDGDKIEDQNCANRLYDFGVNAGQARSIKNLQAIFGLPQTGRITPELMKRINKPENYL